MSPLLKENLLLLEAQVLPCSTLFIFKVASEALPRFTLLPGRSYPWVTILGGSTEEQCHLSIHLWHTEAAVFCSLPRMLVLQSNAAQWDVGI